MKVVTKSLFVLFIATFSLHTYAQATLAVDAKGEKLKQYYQGLNVEQLWPAGQHIDWETGRPDNPDATHNIKTHCSAFAAACERLNIYILRPPEHVQSLLANAQYDWLTTQEARDKGWRSIAGPKPYIQAQEYANKGYIAIAIYQNPDPHKSGHIAMILPAKISTASIEESGPCIIQAGSHNYNSATLLQGFKNHISSWPSTEVLFYYNVNSPF